MFLGVDSSCRCFVVYLQTNTQFQPSEYEHSSKKSPKTQLTEEKRTLRRENHLQPESVEEAFNLVCRLILQDF